MMKKTFILLPINLNHADIVWLNRADAICGDGGDNNAG